VCVWCVHIFNIQPRVLVIFWVVQACDGRVGCEVQPGVDLINHFMPSESRVVRHWSSPLYEVVRSSLGRWPCLSGIDKLHRSMWCGYWDTIPWVVSCFWVLNLCSTLVSVILSITSHCTLLLLIVAWNSHVISLNHKELSMMVFTTCSILEIVLLILMLKRR